MDRREKERETERERETNATYHHRKGADARHTLHFGQHACGFEIKNEVPLVVLHLCKLNSVDSSGLEKLQVPGLVVLDHCLRILLVELLEQCLVVEQGFLGQNPAEPRRNADTTHQDFWDEEASIGTLHQTSPSRTGRRFPSTQPEHPGIPRLPITEIFQMLEHLASDKSVVLFLGHEEKATPEPVGQVAVVVEHNVLMEDAREMRVA